MKKAIILTRSINPEIVSITADTQKNLCQKAAMQQKYCVLKEYEGIPWSKYDSIDFLQDPLTQIKKSAEENLFDVLVVYSFHCIGREDIETQIAIRALLNMEINVHSVCEDIIL